MDTLAGSEWNFDQAAQLILSSIRPAPLGQKSNCSFDADSVRHSMVM